MNEEQLDNTLFGKDLFGCDLLNGSYVSSHNSHYNFKDVMLMEISSLQYHLNISGAPEDGYYNERLRELKETVINMDKENG